MERVAVDDIEREPHPMGVNRERRNLGDALGTDHMAAVHYELSPGESFSGGLHTHHDQEELFVILEGTATFEHAPAQQTSPTNQPQDAQMPPDSDKCEVAAGEAIQFAPGEFQCGRNESDDIVVGLALAAPGSQHNRPDIESFAPCSDCGDVTPHGVREPTDTFVIYCHVCGAEMQIA